MNFSNCNNVVYNIVVIEDKVKYENSVLLKYRIEYPQFYCKYYRYSLAMLNGFYMKRAEALVRYSQTELLEMALEQYKTDPDVNAPVRTFEVNEKVNITYDDACIISLYTDRYVYTGGAHGNTIRSSQTWNLQKHRLIELSELYYCDGDYKEFLLDIMLKKAKKDSEVLFENYAELMRENFKPENFYCLPHSLVIYYQQYDIAPYSSGIREFHIPYGKCISNPKRMCMYTCEEEEEDCKSDH